MSSSEAPPPEAQIDAASVDATPIKAVPVRHYGRWVAGVIILFLAFIVVRSVVTNSALQWPVVGDFLFDDRILRGLQNTLILTVISMLIGIVGGILLAVMRLSPNPLTSGAAAIYIWLFRGTPLITQLIIWNFLGLAYSRIGLGIPFGPTFVSWDTNLLITQFTASLLGLGLNEAAYMAEIVRGGIQSVDSGQLEAASALGMSRTRTLRRIILPQAMRVIIPPTGNETISMLKTTSLVVAIGYFELMVAAQTIYSQNLKTVPLLIVAALWYLFMTSVLTVIQIQIEKRFSRGTSRDVVQRTGWRSKVFGRGGGNVT
ncbi:polar amino acid ABC transporter permease [Amycolatopsis mediterranei S699]|uniref:Permease component of ABC-type amino acid transport system n=2 Tax=Amycolatopsis mediterranei TaxID=33910 RepID=A0A0H3DKZ8_AMYMU|nr:amino acid ABC transporter permease [Amycolatopsis mediterranei]ADJ50897.1 permease component of ABC-type amino acid transport system [Amycolatopsis mediterranei U32]AEK47910.1 polar amino acid ABC transporter permease [Amycolatopsis mediterranei S699]AFO82603.1 polar amino acid ABC transporter permease [Amycolatopsis mediterranei S699]AGT89732.1 polar amino acid ABC transporter permease [Amycolatopsis mediterranei RB]KDO12109.1 ABC transporter permease [Amycolatopsis mediterranei]